MNDGGGSVKARAISMPALALASLLAAAGGCGARGLALPPSTGGAGGGGGSGAGGVAGTTDAGKGGTAGTPDAGSDVAADAGVDSSDVAADAGVDGSDVAADAGRDGSDVAADAGRDGSDVAADAGAPDAGDGHDGGLATDDGVLCPRPAQALITDFTYVPGDGTTAVDFGNGTIIWGTEFVYPVSGLWPVTSDVTGNNWHISGSIGDYSGFGLVFVGCSRVDASAFRGISFTISGSLPQGILTMGVSTLNDTLASSWLNAHGENGSAGPGLCIPTTGTNRFTQLSCADPGATIPIQPTPIVQTILWSDFNGGRPEPHVTPSDILGVYWSFPPPAGVGTTTPVPYPVDIVIDNLAFVP